MRNQSRIYRRPLGTPRLNPAMEKIKPASAASDDESSSCGSSRGDSGRSYSLPEIDATVRDRTILIKIHCQRRKGVLVKALAEIEELGLRVVGTNVVPFADSFLHITLTAQMEEEFSMTIEDLLKELRSAFEKFM